MRPSISPRDRRTLGIGMGLIAVLVTLSRGVPAMRLRLADQAARDAALRERLVSLREAQRQIGPMRDSLRVRRIRLAELNAHLIGASTPTAAAAMLGAIVERIAADAEVKVGSLELRADSSSRATVVRLTLRLSAEGDVFGLATFLSAVERQAEPMTVRTITASASDPLSGDDRAEVVRFDLIIDGLAVLTTEHAR